MLVLKTMLVRHGAETTEVSQGASICVKAWHESPPKEMVVKDAHHVNGLEAPVFNCACVKSLEAERENGPSRSPEKSFLGERC